MVELYSQEYWHTKYPVKPVKYQGRFAPKSKRPIETDVRRFMYADDIVIQEHLIDVLGKDLPSQKYPDEQVGVIQSHTVEYLKYVSDSAARGYKEFWQFANETMVLKTGDCEDGAFYIGSLVLNAVAPQHRWRIRFSAGWVKSSPTAPQGAHGYATWFRTTDNRPVIIDWCFHEDSKIEVANKALMKDRKQYGPQWFSCDYKYAYTKTVDLKLAGRLRKGVVT